MGPLQAQTGRPGFLDGFKGGNLTRTPRLAILRENVQGTPDVSVWAFDGAEPVNEAKDRSDVLFQFMGAAYDGLHRLPGTYLVFFSSSFFLWRKLSMGTRPRLSIIRSTVRLA